MPHYQYIFWIPLLPLLSFVLLGLFGRKYLSGISGILGTLVLLVTTILSCYVAWQYFYGEKAWTLGATLPGGHPLIEAGRMTWLPFSAGYSIDLSLILDPIAVMMIVIVSFVSLMVHIFSLSYLRGEERYATYFAFLALFTFSMLGLVLAGNLFQTYMFWELVGVSSYLLIGFYFQKPSAVAAAKKAFIVTRFADLGFLIGILILSFYGGTLDIPTLIHRLTQAGSPELVSITTATFGGISVLTWGLTLVFIGGAGKSAMFPLHIWLPDAMEGPTPVSALIHAATMVVAGVYLVARLFPIFSLPETSVLLLVRWVGAISALLAGIIACTQTDIKRVLAFSTMSQIGYMLFALGVSGYGGEAGLGYMASMFHLFTHAFFKSLLFLCAGVVIHIVHSNELGRISGMRKVLPLTHVCFLVACLAISGIPPFSGFFSKEEILLAAWRSDKWIYGLGLITSGLTAFYMFRLYFSMFWWKTPDRSGGHGEPAPGLQGAGAGGHTEPGSGMVHDSGGAHRHSEGPMSNWLPLVVLAICTVLAGFLPFSSWVSSDGLPLETSIDWSFSILPVALAAAGIGLAAVLYRKENGQPERIALRLGSLYRLVYAKFYIDEIYLFITKKVLFKAVGRPAAWIDRHVVDGLMNGLASLTAWISSLLKGWQSGRIQRYLLYFFAGILGLAVLFVCLWR